MTELWYDASGPQLGSRVRSTCDELCKKQKARYQYACRMHSIYEGRDIDTLDATPFSTTITERSDELAWPIARSIVDTACTKVYSRSRPRPRIVTTGGTYYERQQARALDKFLEAQYRQPFGIHENLWELTEQCGEDCAKTGVGVAKVFAGESRLEVERINYLELFVDEEEARGGRVRNLFHRYPYSREALIDRFPNKRGTIALADRYDPKNAGASRGRQVMADMVEVTEAWHLGCGDEDGRHVIVVGGANGSEVLVDEPWKRQTFPFAFLRWDPEPFGFWATGLCYVIGPMQGQINRTVGDLAKNARLNSSGFYLEHEDSEIGDQLGTNTPWQRVTWKGSIPPSPVIPPPFSPGHLQWADVQADKCWEFSSVNRMSATGRKEPGITAGVAMREMNDIESERLKPKAVRYENFHVAIGRLAIAAMTELYESGKGDPDDKSPNTFDDWSGAGFLKTLKWSEIKLPEDMYTVSVYAASSLPSTPYARKQSIAEDFELGLIDAQERQRRMRDLDLDAFANVDNAQYDLVEATIGRYLYARDQEHLDKLGGTLPPDPEFPDFPRAIQQVRQCLLSEMAHGDIPEFNQQLLREYIEQCDELMLRVEAKQQLKMQEEMKRQQAQMQPPMAPQGPAGMPPDMHGPPGAPPGMPPGM